MTKLDKLQSDIADFVKDHEPNMLRWTEIVEGLYPKYRFQYKDAKNFGVVVSSKFKVLVACGQLKHEDIFYGTISASTAIASKESLKSNRLLDEKQKITEDWIQDNKESAWKRAKLLSMDNPSEAFKVLIEKTAQRLDAARYDPRPIDRDKVKLEIIDTEMPKILQVLSALEKAGLTST